MQKHMVFLIFCVKCVKNIENICFFQFLGAHGGPSEPVAAYTFLEAIFFGKKPRRFATFFWPAGLGLGSGWVGHFKSKGFVKARREFFQKLVFRVHRKVCFGMLHDSLVRIVPRVPRAAGG